MKRIFAAIDISEDARRKVAAYIETLRLAFPRVRVGWEKPEKLHLTLKFLGGIEAEQLADIKTCIKDISEQTYLFRSLAFGLWFLVFSVETRPLLIKTHQNKLTW